MHKNNHSAISVILLNYNSWKATINYIECLKKQEDIELSILIVDNCSTDNSFILLSKYYALDRNVQIIISEKNGGYSYGINFGLNHLSKQIEENEFVLISNNDIKLENRKLIRTLVDSYSKCNNPAFIAPIMKSHGEVSKYCAWKIPSFKYDIYQIFPSLNKNFYENIFYDVERGSDKVLHVDCLPGSFFMGCIKSFYQIGLLDERTFLYGEERIIAQKVKNINKKNYLIQSIEFEHASSEIIKKEVKEIKRISYILEGRVIFNKYYNNIPQYNLILLSTLNYMYLTRILFAKYIKSFYKPFKSMSTYFRTIDTKYLFKYLLFLIICL